MLWQSMLHKYIDNSIFHKKKIEREQEVKIKLVVQTLKKNFKSYFDNI